MSKMSAFAMLSTAEKSMQAQKSSKRESGASASGSKKMKTNKNDSVNYDIPDRQYGDLFCPICDSHMNSEGMWESHIQGKRHLKNKIKGKPEDDIIEIGSDSKFCDKLDDVKEIIVGLDHVCELVRDEQDPVYYCFLCSANVPNVPQLVGHLITTKHRIAFLKEHNPKGYESIKKLDLRKGQIEPVLEDLCADFERQHGRGKIHIKKETPKPEDDWTRRNKYKQKQSLEKPRNQETRERQKSYTDDYEDSYKRSYEDYDDSYRSSVVTYEYSHTKPIEYPHLKESDTKEDNRSRVYGSRYDSYDDEYFGKSSEFSTKKDLDFREKDLRNVLDDKKRLELAQATPNTSSSNDYFSIIDKMPIDLFLKMTDFKLGSCSFDLPSELALLKKIVEKGQKIIQEKQNNLLAAASKGNSVVWPNMLNQNVIQAPTYTHTHSEIPGLSVGQNQPTRTPTSVDLQKTENFLKTLKLLMRQQ